jgi:hypothetical protein
MSAACHISTRQELPKFIKLWSLLNNVHLRNQEKGTIIWKWEQSGEYSMASAYKIQFQGSHPPFMLGQLWNAKAEPKVKLFGWTTIGVTYPEYPPSQNPGYDRFPPAANG